MTFYLMIVILFPSIFRMMIFLSVGTIKPKDKNKIETIETSKETWQGQQAQRAKSTTEERTEILSRIDTTRIKTKMTIWFKFTTAKMAGIDTKYNQICPKLYSDRFTCLSLWLL